MDVDEKEKPAREAPDEKSLVKEDAKPARPEDEVRETADEEAPKEENEEGDVQGEDDDDEEADEVKLAAKQSKEFPEGFIEWEAVSLVNCGPNRANDQICVSLYDWRTFPEQFASSRDADEKALYQLLSVDVGPTIIDVLVVRVTPSPVE
jgi:hypothetical protein